MPSDVEQCLKALVVPDSAGPAVETITKALESIGFDCGREVPVADRGDGRRGLIDIVAERQGTTLAIEVDSQSPRQKSLVKLQQVPGIKVILLRGGSVPARAPEGIDSVISLRVSPVRVVDGSTPGEP